MTTARTLRITTSLFGLALLTAPALQAQQYQQGPPPPGQYGQQPGYNQPGPGGYDAPPEFDDLRRRAFHDGVEAARIDFDSHRRLDATRAPQFRHPPVNKHDRNFYRDAFSRGYNRFMERRGPGGPGGPPPPPNGYYPR